jgi:flagellar motility protein MotE (MotC chaperone)
MIGSIRLLPLLAFAAFCLLILKMSALMLNGGYIFTGNAPAKAQSAGNAGAEVSNGGGKGGGEAPGKSAAEGNSAAANDKAGETAKNAGETAPSPSPRVVGKGPTVESSNAEFTVLQNLAKRRRDLEALEHGMQLRENLLKATEKRVEARIGELKAIELRINATLKAQQAVESDRFNRLVKMYANMKASDAARIFDRLHIDVLIGLVQNMKPAAMSKILAAMNPAQAERLTIEIAKRSRNSGLSASSLPKIGGKNPG